MSIRCGKKAWWKAFVAFTACGCISIGSFADTTEYSPAVANDYPNRVFWGDTHVHTNLSADAFTLGNRSMTAEQAYRFARGETVMSQTGVRAKLAQPLDFLLVADHAEFLGVFPKVFDRSPDVMQTRLGKRWRDYVDEGKVYEVIKEFAILSMGLGRVDDLEAYVDEDHGVDLAYLESLRGLDVDPELEQAVWQEVANTADRFNQPGLFTAFIGYEWTSTPDGNNLHRNVLFRDSADRAGQVLPASAIDNNDPESLWQTLADYEQKTGGRALAIPHNSNLSNGLMFATTRYNGEPITRDYALNRARWEPMLEVTQMKGDSETHPVLSPNDEYANYETWDKHNILANTPKQPYMLQYEYARNALRNGLLLEQRVGANPFRFGVIGSTDSHNALATAAENNFFGKATGSEPAADRAMRDFSPPEIESGVKNWQLASSGYAAVWAKENTRESLFDAIARRETYATTGPRISLRFFGGWNFEKGDIHRPDFAHYGYRNGVAMGGELSGSKTRAAPSFLVWALKDPNGANLERVQIIKGWLDKSGQTHEKVYTVAAANGTAARNKPGVTRKSGTVAKTASYRNTTGDVQLATVWQDPDFKAELSAFYYVRVIEIPTPRWTAIDAARFNQSADTPAPKFQQERAYSSAIWYRP